MSQAASIAVAVRIRPPTSWEQDRLPQPLGWNDTISMGDGSLASPRKMGNANKSLRNVVQAMDDKVLIFDPKDLDVARSFEQRGFLPPGVKRYKDQRYTFDRVFDDNSQQVDVFEHTTKPLLPGLFDGFNATVFAYGATGCGKTYTISGTETEPGIIYMTMAELFAMIDEKKDELLVEVSLSFLEIYNEEIRDLLVEPGSAVVRGGLAMREDKANRVVVANLTELRPKDADEVKAMVLLGNARRTQSPTHANETSSRSHAVLQINVAQTPRTASTTEERTIATLSIIDLAGSERASATKNMGERMVEGANINKSLLALGNCINALCESGNRTRHVPYRNSKLTRLLKFSLGGNCKTVMIVCVAPTSQHFEDTQNTLKYANRAKNIKTKVSRNYINVDRHVGQYVEAINRLNCEVAELKAKLAGKIGSEGEAVKRKRAEGKAEMDRVRQDIKTKVEQTRPSIVDGGICEANLAVAKARLEAVRPRIGQLTAQAAVSVLPSDLLSEKALLESLAASDEAIVKTTSPVNNRLVKANNANSLFDAMMRAVSERKSDRMDEVMTEALKLDAKLRRTELDLLKSQTKESHMKEIIAHQATMTSDFISVLARCTVMMKDGADALQKMADRLEMNSEVEEELKTILAVAASLQKIAESNDKSFEATLGQSTTSSSNGHTSSLFSFTVHSVRTTHRPSMASGSHTRQRRRSSSSAAPVPPSPAVRRHRTPKKPSAMRKSLMPSGRSVVAKPVEKKGIRWKDQVGDGSLDDAGRGFKASSSRVSSVSEAEWEDVAEKTDSSYDTSGSTLHDNSTTSTGSSDTTIAAPKVSAAPTRKVRAPIAAPSLGSLEEVEDESLRSPERGRGSVPLGEWSNKPLADGQSDTSHTSRDTTPPPKSVFRRLPGSAKKKRVSHIGPLRSEKPRRRSSMIPTLSPQGAQNLRASRGGLGSSTRKVSDTTLVIKSPKKRRSSLVGKPVRASLASSTAGSGSNSSVLVKKPWRPSVSTKLTPITSSPSEAPAKKLWR